MYNKLIANTYFLKYFCLKIQKNKDQLNASFKFFIGKWRSKARESVKKGDHVLNHDLTDKSVPIQTLIKGQILDGLVVNLTSYGAFVDIGGITGMVFIKDITWKRIARPSDVLCVGQSVRVKVMDFTDDKNRITLSMKELQLSSWNQLPNNIFEGAIVEATIINAVYYGLFVSITSELQALVSIKEIYWLMPVNPEILKKDFPVNAAILVKILTIDTSKRKISASIKQVIPDPWPDIGYNFQIGSRYKSIVRSITNYGLLVSIDDKMAGMLHISNLSWTKKYTHPNEFAKIGDVLDIVVLSINVIKRRVDCGYKQLSENPWPKYAEKYPIGSCQKGLVITTTNKGAIILIDNEVKVFAPEKHAKKEDGSTITAGEAIVVKIIGINSEKYRIFVSCIDANNGIQ